MKKGIDVSNYQPNIDYKKAAKEIDFAIIRSSYTGHGMKSIYRDNSFEKHYKGFTDAGVPVGVYHYSCATTVDEGIREANFVLELIKGKKLAYPVIIDIEDEYHQMKAGKKKLTDAVIAFLAKIEASGYFAMFYTNRYWLTNFLDAERMKPYDMWVADWTGTKDNPLPALAGIWQYSEKGKVSGIAGNVDVNRAYKDYPKIMVDYGLNGFKPAPIKRYKLAASLVVDVDALDTMSKYLESLGFDLTITEI